MVVGVPRETKSGERRVGLTPNGVHELTSHGHSVLVEAGAGAGSRLTDKDYTRAGAQITQDPGEVYSTGQLIVKVKEPQPDEVPCLDERHLLFTYLHLAAEPELTRGLMDSGATCVAYETIQDEHGRLPLLTPMSEIAGRVAIQEGARALAAIAGRGVLMSGAPGVAPASVLIVGGGTAGMNAAMIAIGMGGDVTIADKDVGRLRELEGVFGGRCRTRHASTMAVEDLLTEADLVVGAVLVPGGRAPSIVRREQLAAMGEGAVLVDVSIDQGGCFETSRPTTHAEPTYVVDGIVHYCVANMPAAVPMTSTHALTQATLASVLTLAEGGLEALRSDRLAGGLTVAAGRLTSEGVAESLGLDWITTDEALSTVTRG